MTRSPKPRKRFVFCKARCRLAIQCERERGHKGRHAYDLASGGSFQWSSKFVFPRGDRL